MFEMFLKTIYFFAAFFAFASKNSLNYQLGDFSRRRIDAESWKTTWNYQIELLLITADEQKKYITVLN